MLLLECRKKKRRGLLRVMLDSIRTNERTKTSAECVETNEHGRINVTRVFGKRKRERKNSQSGSTVLTA